MELVFTATVLIGGAILFLKDRQPKWALALICILLAKTMAVASLGGF